ncbi:MULTISPECIES: hypothetical protein [unclassified Paenibacillus]|uniref:hypothetical protein n=1 Tax=unclassified Paenibacillus TaxID=185978 RepID=UPI0009563239|nr:MULTISPECIES: hypothetical protein [unclassified Paenibacillus]ASS66365.1 hypothetical protein CIC07_09535 [Paenibacillus sp. RUD330]SIQ06612.1 hypothetical protein SAMN05880555_0514 [Paenibacillus sp. RU4X]SIQ26714.1 hypothetical protein SAMN05880570_0513 [Paenibacillus sp. RU4T]
MKEAIITDLNGLLVDVALVDDRETGYLPIYDTQADDGEPQLRGYRVALPVPGGLHRPRFDREAYDVHLEALEAYTDDLAAWEGLPEDERGDPPTAPDTPAFWTEGLTPEEIEALQPGPSKPSPIEQLQADNTLLLLDLAETQARQAQAEQDNALQLLTIAELECRQQQTEQDYAALLLALAEGEVR